MRKSLRRARYYSLFLVAAAALSSAVAHAEMLFHFDLPAQSLAETLRAIGSTTNTDIGFAVNQVAGLVAPALRADLTVDAALARVLAGTGFRPKHLNDHTIVIAVLDPRAHNGTKARQPQLTPSNDNALTTRETTSDKTKMPSNIRLAMADTDSTPVPVANGDADRDKFIDEIVVTGTQIRGAESTSRVFTYTRAEIQQQGFSNLQDFVQSLPQNFNGGASESTISSVTGGGAAVNAVSGTGINLRGLGNDATLVLIDGHRIAPGNNLGNFVDVSLIPLNAIERVEVVADGASAIYGSDAVGGVVNFILRTDYDGADTRLRYGTVTNGQRDDIALSQSIGKRWTSGAALLVYEYDDTSALYSNDRYFTARSTTQPETLLPQQKVNSFLAKLNQTIANELSIFSDVTFSQRQTDSYLTIAPYESDGEPATINAFSAIVGGRGNLSNRAEFELSAGYSTSRTRAPIDNLYKDGAIVANPVTATDVYSVDAKFDGTLINLPTGPVKFALGDQFRRETYSSFNSTDPLTAYENSRNVESVFGEIHVPIVPADGSAKLTRVELAIADRYEHYSDFGGTNNPKVSVILRPSNELNFRASYGTSFVAPLLYDLNPTPFQVAAEPIPNLHGGTVNALFVFGGNPDLSAQKSTTWTLGADYGSNFETTAGTSVRSYIDYYNTKFNDRITNAQAAVNIFNALQYQSILGPSIVKLNPSAALINAFISNTPEYSNFGVPDLSTIGVLVDSREFNLSSVDTNGIDFGVAYSVTIPIGTANFAVDGTYILKYDEQFTGTSPVTSFLNTPYNPIDLKLRASGSLQSGPISFGIYFNYVNSYKNTLDNTAVPVASWDTIDVTSGYEFTEQSGPMKGIVANIGVTNLANRAPPYVANPIALYGINYDGANANPLGRFVYVQISKRW